MIIIENLKSSVHFFGGGRRRRGVSSNPSIKASCLEYKALHNVI